MTGDDKEVMWLCKAGSRDLTEKADRPCEKGVYRYV